MDPKPENKPGGKAEKSYLTAAVESITWSSSRSSTPKPTSTSAAGPAEASGLKNQHGGDHTTHHWGLSRKDYPPDCPPLRPRWFYAVDVCSSIRYLSEIFKS
jgi:hypothetical protein